MSCELLYRVPLNLSHAEVGGCAIHAYILHALQSSRGLIFAVFADWKLSVKVYTHKNLDQALVQCEANMVTREHNNAKIAESQNLRNTHTPRENLRVYNTYVRVC